MIIKYVSHKPNNIIILHRPLPRHTHTVICYMTVRDPLGNLCRISVR